MALDSTGNDEKPVEEPDPSLDYVGDIGAPANSKNGINANETVFEELEQTKSTRPNHEKRKDRHEDTSAEEQDKKKRIKNWRKRNPSSRSSLIRNLVGDGESSWRSVVSNNSNNINELEAKWVRLFHTRPGVDNSSEQIQLWFHNALDVQDNEKENIVGNRMGNPVGQPGSSTQSRPI